MLVSRPAPPRPPSNPHNTELLYPRGIRSCPPPSSVGSEPIEVAFAVVEALSSGSEEDEVLPVPDDATDHLVKAPRFERKAPGPRYPTGLAMYTKDETKRITKEGSAGR